MSREVLITTPENVAIEYELAGLGSRFYAQLLDLLVILTILIGVTVVCGVIAVLSRFVAAFIGQFLAALYILATFVITWGYFIYFEGCRNGETVGKRVLGLRVMREGGYPVGLAAAFIRNLLRPVDFLPGFYGVGIVSVLVSRRYQRLGDMAAGTIVIKQREPLSLQAILGAARLTPERLNTDALAIVAKDADLLTPDEYLAVRHFTQRRRELSWDAQQFAAMHIAVPMMQRLKIVPPAGTTTVNYADFLEYLSVAYELARRPTEVAQSSKSSEA